MNRHTLPLRALLPLVFLACSCSGGGSGTTSTSGTTLSPFFTTGTTSPSGSSAGMSAAAGSSGSTPGSSAGNGPGSTHGSPTGNASASGAASNTSTSAGASTSQASSTSSASSGGATSSTGGSSTSTTSLGTIGRTSSTGGSATLVAVQVTPPNSTVAVGDTQQFTAVGIFSDGTSSDVSVAALWTSSPSARASVSATGLATALGVGTATITATLNNLSGSGTLIIQASTVATSSSGSTAVAQSSSSAKSTAGSRSTSSSRATTTASTTGAARTSSATSTSRTSSTGKASTATTTRASSTARSTASTGKTATATSSTASSTTTGGEFCPPGSFTADNGDIGAPCTGESPAGDSAVQGSCASGEYCVEYLVTGQPQCTATCESGTCPGNAYCYPFYTDGGLNLCLASCTPSAGGCPDGDICQGDTPNPGDPGLCIPSQCSTASDCNGNGGHFKCVGGLCACTDSATDCVPGATCDKVTGTCYYPCDPTSDPCAAGYGCCGQSQGVDYCDFTQAGGSSTGSGSGSGSGTGTTGTSASGSSTTGTTGELCPPGSFTVDNGDIGAACTGESPAGDSAAQGSCASGEYCLEYLVTGQPQCTAACDTGTCPGNAYCYPFFTDGGLNLCLAACVPSQGGCPDGDLCQGDTPNPGDPGLCVPTQCNTASDCNGTGGHFTCVGGLCACTDSATDCVSGALCDPGSGACYYPCDPSNDPCAAGYGCCGQSQGVDYCDFTQAGSSTSSSSGTGSGTGNGSGTTGTSASGSSTTGTTGEGAHTAWPQVPDNGGTPALAHPRVVTLTYSNDTNAAGIQSWATWAVGSSWLSTVGADYGVGTGTNKSSTVAAAAPGSIDDTPTFSQTSCSTNAQCAKGQACYPEYGLCVTPSALQSLIDAQISSPTKNLPQPDANTVYMIYFPSSTTITSGSEQSCSSFYGYHYAYRRPSNGALVVYAMLPDCTPIQPYSDLQTVTYAGSHELIEAATDPNTFNPKWTLEVPSETSNAWWYTFGEVGDMCVENFYQDSATGNIAQRIWSNSAALADDGSPCVPLPSDPDPFVAESASAQVYAVAAGGTATIDAQAWSNTPVGSGWTPDLFLAGGSANVVNNSSLVTIGGPNPATVNNGTSATFTVNMSRSLQQCDYAYLWLWITAYPSGVGDSTWWPVVVSVGDLSSCSADLPTRGGARAVAGPHFYRRPAPPAGRSGAR